MKKIIAISLSTLLIFLTIGGLFAVSSRADSSVPFLAQNDAGFDSSNITTGTWLYTQGQYMYYAGSTVQGKVARYGSQDFVFGVPESANITFGSYRTSTGATSLYNLSASNIYENIIYYTFRHVGGTVDTFNPDIPVFSNIESALYAMNNGVWEDTPPVDPEFQFDINLGYLTGLSWKQIAVPSSNESMLEVSYNQYTSTGINLMNSGMGVGVRYLAYNSVDSTQPYWVSSPFFHTNGSVLDLTMNWLLDDFNKRYIDGMFTGGGGGHSFDLPPAQDDNGVTVNNSTYYFDLVLFPYYYDGTDYYFGYQSTIEDVYFDYIGTRLIPTVTELDNVETYLNNGQSNTYYYDYGIDSQFIDESYNVYYYQTTNVFNNTGVGDPNDVTFNDIDNSTHNLYNFVGVGSIPDLDIDGLNLNPSQVIDTIKGVITALIVASPLLMGLFDFLPYWAVSLSIACCIAVAAICVIRIFKVGG